MVRLAYFKRFHDIALQVNGRQAQSFKGECNLVKDGIFEKLSLGILEKKTYLADQLLLSGYIYPRCPYCA